MHHDNPPTEKVDDLPGLLDRAAKEMAQCIVSAYETGGRFGYESGPDTHKDPLYKINRILDTAVSRNRVIEQAARCRDEVEELVVILWPCTDYKVAPPQVIIRLKRIAAQLTEVLVDATGD